MFDQALASAIKPVLYEKLCELRDGSFEGSLELDGVLTIVLAEYFGMRMRPKTGPGAYEKRFKDRLPNYALDWLIAYNNREEIARAAIDDNPDITVAELRALLNCRVETAMTLLRVLKRAA
jgi:hypothetical protein